MNNSATDADPLRLSRHTQDHALSPRRLDSCSPDKRIERTTLDDDTIKAALRETLFLRSKMVTAQARTQGMNIHPNHVTSAQNLLSYLALRRHDIRPLQHKLSKLGLSSLGRSEANILASLDRVIEVLQRLISGPQKNHDAALVEQDEGERLLRNHTQALFGGRPPERGPRIMVTMPSEAAGDYSLVKDLLTAGMNCQRINCAHDDPEAWLQMIEHLRRAERASRKACSVMMDLAGPKLRTGMIDPAPAVVRIRPSRDVFGRVTTPAKVWLYKGESSYSAEIPTVKLPGKWLSQLKVDDVVAFRDAREYKRRMQIAQVTDTGCWAELHKTAYLVPGMTLNLKKRKGRKKSARVLDVSRKQEQSIKLREGDRLVLTHDAHTGRPAVFDKLGNVSKPATVGCTLASVFEDIRVGEPIWFDDGKIGGIVETVEKEALHILINHAPGGAKLKSDKGINLPQSELTLDALSTEDIQAMEFACEHADVVQMSFVNTAQDVESLISHLKRLNALDKGVVLKIETRRGFENLAELLVTGMQLPKLGVMIARGDLAIENGFERTAELQEEILCICEAAHVPVIWATQVLETLVKTGSPSRAEITDAATGARAECVMLNKGPFILKAIRCLDDVLSRMQAHHRKKVDLMRRLRVAQTLAP